MNEKQAANVTMSEGGLYSLATTGAKDVIDFATPRVLEAVRAMEISGNRFSMADIGCADGGTSLDMVRSVIELVSSLHPETQINVVYADQTANDFNALVNIVHGQTSFQSWIGEFDNAYPTVSGSSFYLQAVPDESLDLVFSATAMHWLSAKPCNISNHVHMVGAKDKEYMRFANHAKQDWETILLNRARELKPGGRMVLANFCRDEHGNYLGNTGGVNMFDTFNANWMEFMDEGRISREEYENMTLPQYYHTVEEFSAPLEDKNNPCYQAGLRLESIETRIVPCPFSQEFKNHGDAEKFANGLIPTIRSWNQSIFKAGLDADRSETERSQVIEDYYSRYHQKVLENPEGHGMDYVHAYMTIAKIP